MIKSVKEAIIVTAEYYGRQLSETVLNMYASDLADLEPALVVAAYVAYRRNPNNRVFPLPAQIREFLNPEEFITPEAKARETASRIVGAVTKFGWCNGRAAKEFIGPEGWEAVQRRGGWSYICENLGLTLSPTTFEAQIRESLTPVFEHGIGAIESAIGVAPRESAGELTSMKDIMALIPQKPEGPTCE